MGHKERSIGNYINFTLGQQAKYGESKHEAKLESKKEYLEKNGHLKGWNPAKVEGIYSRKTMENYKDAGRNFSEWLKAQGVYKPSDINRSVAALYLKDRELSGKSAWTVSRDMAMINKVWPQYNLSKEELGLRERNKQDIFKGREGIDVKKNSLYEKYSDHIEITKACGCRRQSITKICKEDFVYENGLPVKVKLVEKGGKYREAPILTTHQKKVAEILEKHSGEGPIFKSFNKNINNHYFRAKYAKELADALKKEYEKTGKIKLGNVSLNYLVNLSKKDRSGSGLRYGLNKNVAGAVSGALGHNRIDVLTHYLY